MTKKSIVFILVACIVMACFANSASAAVIEPDIEPMATYYRSAYAKIDISDSGKCQIKTMHLVGRSFHSNTYEWTPAQYSISDR